MRWTGEKSPQERVAQVRLVGQVRILSGKGDSGWMDQIGQMFSGKRISGYMGQILSDIPLVKRSSA